MSAALGLAAAAAFNLVCHTTTTLGPADLLNKHQITVYRIDLDKRRYCSNVCRETMPIEHVGETEIVLTQRSTPSAAHRIIINRESGAISQDIRLKEQMSSFRGQCVPDEFSGFPTKQF